MQTGDILLSDLDDHGILRLTLNDPHRRNALSEAMLSRLGGAIAAAGADGAVRVVVLAATGPAFCAGHDLKELTAGRAAPDGGRAYFTRIMALCSALMQAIVACPKPVIAEVAGVATARFSTPGVHIGLFCSTPMVALSRNLAQKHAMEMLLTGDMIPADRAAETGLVNRIVAPADLRAATIALAHQIASKSAMTLATGKRAFHAQRGMDLAAAYDHASAVMVENLMARDACEGIDAFIAKRAPHWQDR